MIHLTAEETRLLAIDTPPCEHCNAADTVTHDVFGTWFCVDSSACHIRYNGVDLTDCVVDILPREVLNYDE